MSELISGKDALMALANGKEVEFKSHMSDSVWLRAKELKASEILNHCMVFGDDRYSIEFRLKPRTITLNGVEVPTPFEPKEGDEVWNLSSNHDGYVMIHHHNSHKYAMAVWRTEEEIKQVVAALRQVFRG